MCVSYASGMTLEGGGLGAHDAALSPIWVTLCSRASPFSASARLPETGRAAGSPRVRSASLARSGRPESSASSARAIGARRRGGSGCSGAITGPTVRGRRPAGVPLNAMRRDQGWCEDPESPRYNRPVRLPAADCTDRMWREDHLYDLTFVLDQNFSRRAKGRGSAIFFHLARPGLTPTAGCVAISAADMRKLAPRLSAGRGHGDR